MKNKTYIVAPGKIASSRADGKFYREGETIDLSHCTPEEIQNLILIGVVFEPIEQKQMAAKAEVKDG